MYSQPSLAGKKSYITLIMHGFPVSCHDLAPATRPTQPMDLRSVRGKRKLNDLPWNRWAGGLGKPESEIKKKGRFLVL